MGSRVVIPKPGRAQIFALLHEGQPGISKMKGLARSYVWWPNIYALESQVKQCNQCQLNRPSLPAVPMHPWEWPDHPWDCIHVDCRAFYGSDVSNSDRCVLQMDGDRNCKHRILSNICE